MSFNYFYGEQSEQFSFYRIPKVFYTDAGFRQLSKDARVLYGILLDRVSLSARNSWYDEAGRVYIICTLQSVMEMLGITDKTATKLFVELENFGLIERKRQGQGKPIIIYVKNFIDSDFLRVCNQKSSESGVVDITSQGSEKVRCNKTDINNTDFNNTDFILSEREEERRDYEAYFREQLQLDWLMEQHPYERSEIEEIFELIVDTVCSTAQTIRISGDDKPANVVKSRFMKLDTGHMEFVLSCLKENTTRVRSIKSYLLATLYNAPLTISNYYQALVQSDMAEGKI